MNPQVSVILSTYNRSAHLSESISSILNQSYPHFELIIVDDGSTDETQEIIAGFSDPRILLLSHDRNLGAARAFNTGISASQGLFIGFIGSEDVWLPEKLEENMSSFSQLSEEYGAVYSDMWEVDPAGECRYWKSPEIAFNTILNEETLDYQVCCLGSGVVLFRRECFEKVGLFDEQFPCYIDLELLIRVSQVYRLFHIRKPLYIYRSYQGICSDPYNICMARLLLLKKYNFQVDDPDFLIRQCDYIQHLFLALKKKHDTDNKECLKKRKECLKNKKECLKYRKEFLKIQDSITWTLLQLINKKIIEKIIPPGSKQNTFYHSFVEKNRKLLKKIL